MYEKFHSPCIISKSKVLIATDSVSSPSVSRGIFIGTHHHVSTGCEGRSLRASLPMLGHHMCWAVLVFSEPLSESGKPEAIAKHHTGVDGAKPRGAPHSSQEVGWGEIPERGVI